MAYPIPSRLPPSAPFNDFGGADFGVRTQVGSGRTHKTLLKGTLLSASCAASLMLSIGLPSSLHAQSFGGAGGISSSESGVGGGFGVPGADGSSLFTGGGGGGGAGAAGGEGGGSGRGGGGIGGISGMPGGNGMSAAGGEGGGGGGGGGGSNGSTLPTMTAVQPVGSASGAAGGEGGSSFSGGGGGGGSGGYGVVSLGAAQVQISDKSSIFGGAGGGGGFSFIGSAGNGGDGGVGVFLPAGSSLTLPATSTIAGGEGGAGGDGFDAVPGNGGNGGAGVLGAGLTVNNNGSILGGAGGSGGSNNFGAKGAGGAGGAGIVGSDLTINNIGGTIAGGQGGISSLGENGPGPAGLGGIGIVGSNLTINNTGIIAGGLSGDGALQAYAIQLTGGTNYVGTGGTITGGINVLAGSFQPALNGTVPGTPLTVDGPITFAVGSFYNVRITPTGNDSVVATGRAMLGGAIVNVLAGQGIYATRQYTILTANGGLGETPFGGVTSNLAFLMPTLTYVDNDVVLNITGGGANGTVDYRTAAGTQNQLAVASGLTVASNANGNSGPILNALNQLTVPQAQAAFDALSGEGIIAAQNAAHRQVDEFTSSIFDQTTFYGGAGAPNSITLTAPRPGAGFFALAPSGDGTTRFTQAPLRELADLPSTRAAPPPPAFAPVRTWRAWATGFGGAEDIQGQAGIGSANERDSVYGGSLGVDYQLTPNYLAGVAIGGSDGEFNVAGRATSGSTTGGHVAFYDLAEFGPYYGASSNSFSYFGNKTTRNIAGFGGLAGETDRGNFDSHEFRTRLEFGRHFGASGLGLSGFGFGGVITPFIALEIAELRSNGFVETNLAGPTVLGLNVQGQSSADVPSFVGLRYQGLTPLGNGMALSPSLQVAYIHEFAPQRTQIGGLINLPGSTFLVDGARPSSNAVQAKAGAELAIGPRSVIFATFDGEFSGQAQFYGGKGGFKYLW